MKSKRKRTLAAFTAAKALTDFGVDLAQGYLFARPAPAGEVLAVDASQAAP